jgi:hypothetical protein
MTARSGLKLTGLREISGKRLRASASRWTSRIALSVATEVGAGGVVRSISPSTSCVFRWMSSG